MGGRSSKEKRGEKRGCVRLKKEGLPTSVVFSSEPAPWFRAVENV